MIAVGVMNMINKKLRILEKEMALKLEKIHEDHEHKGNRGDNSEEIVREFLRSYLPAFNRIGQGELSQIKGYEEVLMQVKEMQACARSTMQATEALINVNGSEGAKTAWKKVTRRFVNDYNKIAEFMRGQMKARFGVEYDHESFIEKKQ